MTRTSGPQRSEKADEVSWIAGRLSKDLQETTTFVPRGYEAYARVLHPAEEPDIGAVRPVRWRQVAEWSGVPLRNDAQFHSIAMPSKRPAAEPIFIQGPRQGSLYAPDARVVAEIAKRWTQTPDRCWFCLWDGYGKDYAIIRTEVDEWSVSPSPDPIPHLEPKRSVQLRGRNYFLYGGPIEAICTTTEQSPNLWWPQDRAWCVASELDLQWTYVGGPSQMIEQLVIDDRIEALYTEPDDPATRIEEWLKRIIDAGLDEIMSSGTTRITTSRGTVEAVLVRPGRFRKGEFSTHGFRIDGQPFGGLRVRLTDQSDEALRGQVAFYLTKDVITLSGESW